MFKNKSILKLKRNALCRSINYKTTKVTILLLKQLSVSQRKWKENSGFENIRKVHIPEIFKFEQQESSHTSNL